MARAQGVDAVFGVKAGATWGTWNTTVDEAGRAFRAKTWTFTPEVETLDDTGYNAEAFMDQSVSRGNKSATLTFDLDMKYEGSIKTLLALAMGTGGSPTLQTTGYKSIIIRKKNMIGVFASFAFDDGDVVYKIDSAKCTSFKLTGAAGKILNLSMTWLCRDYTTAATGSLSSLTERAARRYIEMDDDITTYTIGTQGGALAAFELLDWELDYARAYKLEYSSSTAPAMREPEAGRSTATLRVNRPADAMTYLTALAAGTIYEISLDHVLTTNEFEFTVQMPSAQVIACSRPMVPEGLVETVVFGLKQDFAGASTVQATGKSLYFDVVDSLNADPLVTA